jgi:hypothetical protein
MIETPEEIEVGKECLDCSIDIDVLCKSWLLPLFGKKSTGSNFECWAWDIWGCIPISLFCRFTSDLVLSFTVWLPSDSPELLSSSSDEWPVADESTAFLFLKNQT